MSLAPDIADHVVGEVDHADFGSGPSDADGPDEQSHSGFLLGEYMLDMDPNL